MNVKKKRLTGNMTENEFNTILENRIKKIKETLSQKGKEYSSVTDRLSNFKRGAEIARNIPEQALCGMMLKHEVSVKDMIDDVARGVEFSEEYINEKIGDYINYLILLEALLLERFSKNRERE